MLPAYKEKDGKFSRTQRLKKEKEKKTCPGKSHPVSDTLYCQYTNV